MFVESVFFGIKCLQTPTALEFFTLFLWSFSSKLNECFQHTGFWSRLYRSWDYPENFGIYYQLEGKIKTRSFAFFNVYVFWIENGPKFWSHSFRLQNSAIFQTRVNQRGDPMKMSFNNFQIQQLISEIVRAQKVDEKSGVICLVSFFWFLSYGP